jgi:hypothetical protein
VSHVSVAGSLRATFPVGVRPDRERALWHGSGRAALAKRRGLADARSKEGELLAARHAVAHDLDLVDAWRMDHEGTFNPDAARYTTDGDRLVQATAAHPHHGSLEHLDSLTISLDHFDGHTNGVARSDLWEISP